MDHLRRDKETGVFTSYFNTLSGDVLNQNKSWSYRNDTLNLMGFNYKLMEVSKEKDTIILEKMNVFQPSRKYYLIDSKLMNEAALNE